MNTSVSLSNVPDTATPLPVGGIFPDFQQNSVAASAKEIDRYNAVATAGYQGKVQNWQINAAHCRDLGIPLPTKPIPTSLNVLNVSVPDDFGTIYVWVSKGDPVGPPCPDLPALPEPLPNHISIGPDRGGGFYLTNSDDTMPTGSIVDVTPNQFPGVPMGKYSKVGSMMRGVSWYFKFA